MKSFVSTRGAIAEKEPKAFQKNARARLVILPANLDSAQDIASKKVGTTRS